MLMAFASDSVLLPSPFLPMEVLTMKANKPKAAFLVGNGLSIDFLNSINIQCPYSLTKLSGSKRVNSNVDFTPIRMEIADLGSIQKYCQKRKYVKDSFDKYLNRTPSMPAPPLGVAQVSMSQHGLHSFLWSFFIDFDVWFRQSGASSSAAFGAWKWSHFLKKLDSRFCMSFISYNYDFIIPSLLSYLSPDGCKISYNVPNADFFEGISNPRIIPIHGNISILKTGYSFGDYSQKGEVAMHWVDYPIIYEYPPDLNMPFPVNLIPPGFLLSDAFTHRFKNLWHSAEKVIRNADYLFLAGLSFQPPDDREFEALCGRDGLKGKYIFHCVPKKSPRIQRLIEGLGGTYKFVSSDIRKPYKFIRYCGG